METLSQFMARRRSEIEAEIERLKLELRQIALAESVGSGAPPPRAAEATGQPETIKGQVLKILADAPRGMTANDIQARLAERFGRVVRRESLSPQLSRLGAEGVIAREGKVWLLPVVDHALMRYREGMEIRRSATNGAEELPLVLKENPQEVHS